MSEEKELRLVECLVQCGGCPKKLRIVITVVNYGKTMTLRCASCQTHGKFTVPKPTRKSGQKVNTKKGGSTSENLFDDLGLGSLGLGGIFRIRRKR